VITLETERLVLRPFRSDDVDAFDGFARHDDYRRFLGEDHPDPATFVANNVGGDGAWVIELDGRVVGSIFLGEELACLLDPSVHGAGIATEAARAVLDDAFGRRGHDVVVANAEVANEASRRALAHLGFTATGERSFRLHRGDWR
jgi:RimJ/RimL family protein N-acetyltransferase